MLDTMLSSVGGGWVSMFSKIGKNFDLMIDCLILVSFRKFYDTRALEASQRSCFKLSQVKLWF